MSDEEKDAMSDEEKVTKRETGLEDSDDDESEDGEKPSKGKAAASDDDDDEVHTHANTLMSSTRVKQSDALFRFSSVNVWQETIARHLHVDVSFLPHFYAMYRTTMTTMRMMMRTRTMTMIRKRKKAKRNVSVPAAGR